MTAPAPSALAPGFHDVPKGMIATVVTHLEMRRSPPPKRPTPAPPDLALRQVQRPCPDVYRDLFRRVGADRWLWFSRLALERTELAAILHDPRVDVWTVEGNDGRALGLLELDFRIEAACELAFLGLEASLTGRGVGRWVMNHAIRTAWANGIDRFHVHTCTLDSPAALPFYIGSGFTPIRQQIEIAPDPRLTGLIRKTAAPQIPVFAP